MAFQCLDCGREFSPSRSLACGCDRCGSDQIHPVVEWAEGDRAELPAPVPAAGRDDAGEVCTLCHGSGWGAGVGGLAPAGYCPACSPEGDGDGPTDEQAFAAEQRRAYNAALRRAGYRADRGGYYLAREGGPADDSSY